MKKNKYVPQDPVDSAIDIGGRVHPSIKPAYVEPGTVIEKGISLRNHYAGIALGPLIAKLNFTGGYREESPEQSDILAKSAFTIADAMVRASKLK